MQDNGMAPGQVVQIRGYADQQLRRKELPQDPSNRRITVIVQYMPKVSEDARALKVQSLRKVRRLRKRVRRRRLPNTRV
jgi:chemotaxis protein MotB